MSSWDLPDGQAVSVDSRRGASSTPRRMANSRSGPRSHPRAHDMLVVFDVRLVGWLKSLRASLSILLFSSNEEDPSCSGSCTSLERRCACWLGARWAFCEPVKYLVRSHTLLGGR
jgi:hypothetical protein